MKARLAVIGMTGVILVTGCQQRTSGNDKIAELQSRIVLLETNLATVQSGLRQMVEVSEKQTRALDLLQAKQDAYQDQIEKVSEAMFEALQKSGVAVNRPAPAAGGIPAAVYGQFKLEAEKLYPNDYNKQTAAIQTMLASYRKSMANMR